MAVISTAIELQDNFTGIMNGIINSVNMSVSVMEQMQKTMNSGIDTAAIQGIREQLDEATLAVQELNSAMQSVRSSAIDSPVVSIDSGFAEVQANTAGGLEIPITPYVTEDPVIDVPKDVSAEISLNGISESEKQIEEITNRLISVTQMQEAIKNVAGAVYILPEDTLQNIEGINQEISRMEQAIDVLKTNPLNLDSSFVELQIKSISESLDELTAKQREIDISMGNAPPDMIDLSVNPIVADPPSSVQVPVEWQSNSLDVFTGTGIDRFRQETESANAMLQQLSRTQEVIARRAYNTTVFPPEASRDLNSMAVRVDEIRNRIAVITNNPLNMGTDTANSELEQLRSQLSAMIQEQQNLNRAVNEMDIEAANESYLRMSNIVDQTERHIRDNTDEQGNFNRQIREGTNAAENLKDMIKGAVAGFIGMAGIKKTIDFINDCTDAYNTQINAENQLAAVLANTIGGDYVSEFEIEASVTADTAEAVDEINNIQNGVDEVVIPVSVGNMAAEAAFDEITSKASEIQSRGIYGDEAMIAGAAEFATYFSDTEAITMMMDTLADYAMGMSGGGALDSSAIVTYATNLGKIMTGSYQAMKLKGFEFTEAQQAIIEGTATEAQIVSELGEEYLNMSKDMQAAAAITAVIDESWAGLYETMSDTPQGKIIQMTNTWGDMKEVIGGQLYPYLVKFADVINKNWGTIETVVGGITAGLEYVLDILACLFDSAFSFAQMVIDNWSWISPVIYGIIAALSVYYGKLLLTKGAEVALKVAQEAVIFGKLMMAAATWALTGATWAEATAMWGLDAAMYACPIVWFIILVIGLIAILITLCNWIAEVTGEAESGIGIIVGALAAAAAFIGNLFVMLINFVIDIFVVLWNFIAAFVNFFGNVFNDPIGAIARLFFDLVDTVLALLQSLASAIDTIFGSSLAESVQGWRDSLSGWVDETFGQGEEIMAKVNAEDYHLERFDIGEAWEAGTAFGDEIAASFDDFDILDMASNVISLASEALGDNDVFDSSALDGIDNNVSDIAGDTEDIAESMSLTEEDLKYLRDMAEMETVNRFTTAEINIDMSGMNNTIKNGDDLDGFVSSLTDMVNEAVDIMAEGAYN